MIDGLGTVDEVRERIRARLYPLISAFYASARVPPLRRIAW